jgi:GH24 family phage-related lysozyme (muramidase)
MWYFALTMNTESLKARMRAGEGSIAHMYKCTGGKVTIGVGHAIEDAATACTLNWTIDGAPAAADRVRADFAAVAAAATGAVARTYEPLTSCRMSPESIDALLEADIQRFIAGLRQIIPDFDRLPDPAQEALFDMGFNLGIGGLQKFRNLLAAVASRDWERAAAECHRKGIGDARNAETAALFRQAGAAGVTATD